MRRFGLVALFLIAMHMLVSESPVKGHAPENTLLDKRITVKLKNKPFYDFCLRLIYDNDIPIGFEQSVFDSDHNDYFFQTDVPYDQSQAVLANGKRFSIPVGRPRTVSHLLSMDFENARLEDILNDLTRQLENYQWEIVDGIVNIFPVKGRDPKIEELLNLRVSKFSAPKNAPVIVIESIALNDVPEAAQFLLKHDLLVRSQRQFAWYVDRPLPQTMTFQNLKFIDLLNSITREKRGGWIIKTFPCQNNGTMASCIQLLM